MKPIVNHNIQAESWYSPKQIVEEFQYLLYLYTEEELKDRIFQRAREMFIGAVNLLGAYELGHENLYFLQSNNQTSSPDVMAVKQVVQNGAIHALLTQMEVVGMDDNAPTDDIVEFLKMTKLAPTKAYNEHDMIVLTINRKVPYNAQAVHESLKELNPKPTIYLLGRKIGAVDGDFMISTPWPILYPPIDYNIIATASKYTLPPRVQFNLGIETEIKYTKSTNVPRVNIYDVMGIDKIKVDKKFGVKI